MITEDHCAIIDPALPDWLISGEGLTHQLNDPTPPAHHYPPTLK